MLPLRQLGNYPFHDLLDQVNAAARIGLHLVALGMAVALPDICVSLMSDDGRSNGERYRRWCADVLTSDKFSFVTPDDLWSMRCGVLHNGRFGDLKHSVSRVLFALPGSGSIVNCKLDDAYLYGVEDFCSNMTAAARTWFEQNRHDLNIQANMKRLMRYHRGGLNGVFSGMSCIG